MPKLVDVLDGTAPRKGAPMSKAHHRRLSAARLRVERGGVCESCGAQTFWDSKRGVAPSLCHNCQFRAMMKARGFDVTGRRRRRVEKLWAEGFAWAEIQRRTGLAPSTMPTALRRGGYHLPLRPLGWRANRGD